MKEAKRAQAGGSEAEEVSEMATVEEGRRRRLWAERRGGSWRPGLLSDLVTKMVERYRVVEGQPF